MKHTLASTSNSNTTTILTLKKEEIEAGWEKILKRIEEAKKSKPIEQYTNNLNAKAIGHL